MVIFHERGNANYVGGFKGKFIEKVESHSDQVLYWPMTFRSGSFTCFVKPYPSK